MKYPELLSAPKQAWPESFAKNPSPIDGDDTLCYRKALSCFPTGVTVVTTHWQSADWGMTCNSFASVSLDPRMVLWSIRKQANSLLAFTQSDGFTVSVLAEHQINLAKQFSKGSMPERFMGIHSQRLDSDRLFLREAVAWFDCSLKQLIDAGDHLVLLGQVNDFSWQDGASLNYCRSQFGQFHPIRT